MKITKAVREGMERRLNAKIEVVNQAERKEYDKRRSACVNDLYEWLEKVYPECESILSAYGMDIPNDAQKFHNVIKFFENDVCNRAEERTFAENAYKRRSHRADAIERIEFECALGTDKDTFLAMLDAVTFE